MGSGGILCTLGQEGRGVADGSMGNMWMREWKDGRMCTGGIIKLLKLCFGVGALLRTVSIGMGSQAGLI